MAAVAAYNEGKGSAGDEPTLPQFQCQQPVQLLGVQPETPLCPSDFRRVTRFAAAALSAPVVS